MADHSRQHRPQRPGARETPQALDSSRRYQRETILVLLVLITAGVVLVLCGK